MRFKEGDRIRLLDKLVDPDGNIGWDVPKGAVGTISEAPYTFLDSDKLSYALDWDDGYNGDLVDIEWLDDHASLVVDNTATPDRFTTEAENMVLTAVGVEPSQFRELVKTTAEGLRAEAGA